MLIDTFIAKQFDEQMTSASEAQIKRLDKEVNAICLWSCRQGSSLTDSKYSIRPILRVYSHNGKPVECRVDEVRWGLQNANRKHLKMFDAKIFDTVKLLRQIGFTGALVVLYGKVFDYAHSPDVESKYANTNSWVGIHLLLRRLYSTTRIALRYNYPDEFGPRIIEKDGKVLTDYSKEPWKKELMKRGILKKKGASDG